MKFLAQGLSSAIVAVVVILSSSPRPAVADSYTIYNLGNDNARGIYGIDATGDVVTWGSTGCGAASVCYSTYVDGVATGDGSTAPVLAYDNGTACGSAPAGFTAYKSVCNGEWVGLNSLYSPNGDPNGVYVGSDSSMDFLAGGSADQLFLNSSGDFAWVDGLTDQMFVAVLNSEPVLDLSVQSPNVVRATTPEPATLLLMLTGLTGVMVLALRKANRYRDLSE